MQTLPNEIVQGYNSLNQNQAFDLVWILVTVSLILGGVMSIYKRLQEL